MKWERDENREQIMGGYGDDDGGDKKEHGVKTW